MMNKHYESGKVKMETMALMSMMIGMVGMSLMGGRASIDRDGRVYIPGVQPGSDNVRICFNGRCRKKFRKSQGYMDIYCCPKCREEKTGIKSEPEHVGGWALEPKPQPEPVEAVKEPYYKPIEGVYVCRKCGITYTCGESDNGWFGVRGFLVDCRPICEPCLKKGVII